MATAEAIPYEAQLSGRESLSLAALAQALAKAQGEFPTVLKDRLVSIRTDKGTYSYTYADLASVLAAVTPALSKHGLALVQRPQWSPDSKAMVLETRLLHSSGEWMACSYPLPAASDPKAMGSALTYARRYSATAMLGIAAEEDDDGDAASQRDAPGARTEKPKAAPSAAHATAPAPVPAYANADQVARLVAAIDASGFSIEDAKAVVKRVAGVDSLKAVTVDKVDALLKAFAIPAPPDPDAEGAEKEPFTPSDADTEWIGQPTAPNVGPETAVVADPLAPQRSSDGAPACPACGKTKSVISNKFQPGAFSCWKKSTREPGCGHVWTPGR